MLKSKIHAATFCRRDESTGFHGILRITEKIENVINNPQTNEHFEGLRTKDDAPLQDRLKVR